MKTTGVLAFIFTFGSSGLLLADVVKPAPAADSQIVEKGPHHRVWSRTVQDRAPDGKLISRVSQVTELASGMHRLTEQGEWVTASDELTLVDGGAAANNSA